MLIDLGSVPSVAMDFMNDVHNEDVGIINELYDLIVAYESESNAEIAEAISDQYEKWYRHTMAHFTGEEEKMIETGFPPYQIHKGEHNQALDIMRKELNKWNDTRDLERLKRYVGKDAPAWLQAHIETMDVDTAIFLEAKLSPHSID